MKQLSILLFAGFSCIALVACNRSHTQSTSDVGEQLTEQFRSQQNSKSQTTPRKLKSVSITSFDFPSGNAHPYLGVAVAWEDNTTYTSLPMVQLGDGLFGVSYEDPKTKEDYSAIINFR